MNTKQNTTIFNVVARKNKKRLLLDCFYTETEALKYMLREDFKTNYKNIGLTKGFIIKIET